MKAIDANKLILSLNDWALQESYDLSPVGGKNAVYQTLQEVMKEAIFEKPAEHCFEQVSEMTEHNAMVRIGG